MNPTAHQFCWLHGMCSADISNPPSMHGDLCNDLESFLAPLKSEVMDLGHIAPAQAGRLLGMIDGFARRGSP